MKIKLFTTLGCHLCDLAFNLLVQAKVTRPELEVVSVEIAEQDSLMEEYGIRIPVVQLTGATDDLGWPFDLPELLDYLDKHDRP